MNRVQNNKLASYIAVETVLKADPSIETVTGLPAKVAMLSKKIADIDAVAGTQTQPLAVSIARREQIFEAMAEMSLEVAGAVANVARDNDMRDLLQVVRVSPTMFRHQRRSHRIWIAKRIADAAATVQDRLGAYGVTAETLAALQASITVASENAQLPRTARTARKAATGQLVELFQETDALLQDEIDRLVIRLRRTQPEFFKNYRAARAIVNYRGGRPAADEAEASEPAGGAEPSVAAVTTPVNLAA